MKEKKHVNIRIYEAMLRKLQHVSQHDDRSVSSQIMFLINKNISDFEEKHGNLSSILWCFKCQYHYCRPDPQ